MMPKTGKHYRVKKINYWRGVDTWAVINPHDGRRAGIYGELRLAQAEADRLNLFIGKE